MMNNPSVIQAAEKLAARLMETVDYEDEDRVRLAYRLVVSREPSADELKVALGFIDDVRQESDSLAWAGFCQSLFGSSEFRYLN
jgi:hypothetical protein